MAAWTAASVRTGPGPRPASARPTPTAAGSLAAGTAGTTSVVLVGPTGIGKTALAAELAARQSDRLDVAWWFRGASRAMVAADARTLAGRLGDDGIAGREAVAHVRAWLEQTERRWLMIVDGVADWDDVADLIPTRGRGLVVVTTSNPALVPPVNATAGSSPALDHATGAAFLLARASRSEPPLPCGWPNGPTGCRWRWPWPRRGCRPAAAASTITCGPSTTPPPPRTASAASTCRRR